MDFSTRQQRNANLLYFKVVCGQLSIVNLQDDTLILQISPLDLNGGGMKNCLCLFICSLVSLDTLIGAFMCHFYTVEDTKA